ALPSVPGAGETPRSEPRRRRGAGAVAAPPARSGAADGVCALRREDTVDQAADEVGAGFGVGTVGCLATGRPPHPGVGEYFDARPGRPRVSGHDRLARPCRAAAAILARARDHGEP